MKYVSLATIIFLYSGAEAKADSWYQLVSYTCDQQNNRILIELRGAYNDDGFDMVKNKRDNEWDPWSLLVMKDDDHIDHTIWIKNQCRLSDGDYEVDITAFPENFNIQGHCGAAMSALAEVRLGSRTLLSSVFDEMCRNPERPAYRQFIVHAQTHEVTLVP